jgi:squalene-associated FAD-dependent desaturase
VTPVVIVGGGLAGLAAAVELTARSVPVLVLEQRPVPGGRTRSFRDRDSGDVLDNGQHLLIAGYRHTLRFLEEIGTLHLLRIQRPARYLFHHPERGVVAFTLPRLVPPLNFLVGVLRSPLLTPGDRVRMLRAGASVLLPGASRGEETVAQWLVRTGQSPEARRTFWDPMAVSMMNVDPAEASAQCFRAALRGTFLQGGDSASPAFPTVGLSDLLIWPAVRAIERGGGTVRCGAAVESLLYERGLVAGVRMRDGSTVEAAAVVLAVPPGPLNPRGIPDGVPTEAMPDCSPIITIYLWFDGHPIRDEVVGYLGRTVQWTFDRSTIGGRDPRRGQLCAAVISAARAFDSVSNGVLVERVVGEIAGAYGQRSLPLRRALVLRERCATVALTPALERARPATATPVANLFRAGDWTATGIPATIEGAIQSGMEAAGLVATLGT